MTEQVRLERRGEVGLIVIDNPPVNALGHAARSGLLRAITAADADPALRAIVVSGAGKHFIAGSDIREMGAVAQAPLLNDVLLRLEACGKPVIAALHGSVMGGGFELALAAHYRCASPDAQLSLPEVKLGLLPGAGGTVRLSRVIGVKAALDWMVSGDSVDAARARTLGLIDQAFDGDLVEAAVDYARSLSAPRRLRERPLADGGADAAFFAAYRQSLSRAARRQEAVERIIRCEEAAVSLPFDAALAFARERFEECRASSQSAALRHLFFAERGARAADGETPPMPVREVCVIGAGTMGAGIATSFATRGLDVTLIDAQAPALESGIARVHTAIETALQKKRLTVEAAAAAKARVRASAEIVTAAAADLVIEAVFESMAVKQELFRQLDGVCPAGTLLATNTSTLDVDAIASATGRPAQVLGMHFFSPANIMPLVEIVRGRDTAPASLARALAVTRRIGKIGVVVGNGFGFVGNRMLYAYGRENQLMLLEGVAPERIDAVLEDWGMAMGPNAVGDLAGLDVGYAVRRERKDLPNDPRFYRIADALVERGRLGQKSGRGMYLYDQARARRPDPQMQELIRAEAGRLGVAPREMSDAQIIERCIYALINEGAALLEQGIAASPADIDVIWCNGYGFPRTRGGPLFYADTLGLPAVYARVRALEAEQGSLYWTPAPLLARLAQDGSSFGAWQAARRV